MAVMTNAAAEVTSREREPLDRLARIIRAEFEEMPGMWLTRTQFRRLWHLSDADCDSLLGHLLGTGFLTERGRGIGRPSDL